jgi:hypothetical protein
MTARRLTLTTLVSLCSLAGALALSSVSAMGAVTQFGSFGSGAGQFVEPRGVAVDQESGDVYVVDSRNNRLERFTSEGAFLLAWGWGVADGETQALQTCVTTCHPGLVSAGSGAFSGPEGVAVDNDPLSPSHGDVYVDDTGNNRVEKFGPEGEFLLMFGGEVNETTKGDVCLAGEACEAGVRGTENGQIHPTSVAVGPTGTVYVGDEFRVQEFSSEGLYESQLVLPRERTSSVAVDSSGDPYAISENGSGESSGVLKYGPSGELLQTLDGGGQARAVALDPGTGHVFIDDYEEHFSEIHHHLLEYNSAGEQLASFDSEMEDGRSGIAFGESIDGLYLLTQNNGLARPTARVRIVAPPAPGPLIVGGEPTAVEPTTAVVHALINPEENITKYRIEYGTTTSYGASAPVPDGEIAASFEDRNMSVELSGLSVQTTYHYRAVASNHCNPAEPAQECIVDGPDQTFTTLPPAFVDSESVSDVSATGATLEAVINPLGSDTTYHFQYGPTTACGGAECSIPLPDADAGSGKGDTTVSPQHLQGLQPATLYHYHVVANNALGTVEGEDHTFTTQPSGSGSALPDSRQWELVSPPDKHGALLEGIGQGVVQAATNGAAIAYSVTSPTEANVPGYAFKVNVMSVRDREGWASRDLTTTHTVPTTAGGESEYQFFSPDLSLAILHPNGFFEPSLSPEASEQTTYLATNYLNGRTSEPCSESCYRPLVSGCPPVGTECKPSVQEHADVPPGTVFGRVIDGKCQGCGPRFVGASPDLRHVILESEVALTSDATHGGLYEWSDGKLALISILPNGEQDPREGPHGEKVDGFGNDTSRLVRGAVSSDGSRVVWTASELGGGETHLYMRENAMQPQSPLNGKGECAVSSDACTVQLDAVQGGSGSSSADPKFNLATTDGSKVFFADTQRLTADSGEEGYDLYECEMVEEMGQLRCRLSDLTPVNSSGEGGKLPGQIIGISEDGSYLYFTGLGKLTSDAVEEGCNLYVRHDGVTKLVAVLSCNDSGDWGQEFGHIYGPNLLTARVSPDGRWLAFMSQRGLTGYDTRNALTGTPDEEVYLYDASAGRVVCASCDPTGARPLGAAQIPGWTPYISDVLGVYQSRYLSDSGRLFFDSADGLVPGDVNGGEDVYQYEPPGVGDCAVSGAGYSERSGGCVGLISSGSDAEASVFIDASETGGDVFFLTAGKLAPQDVDKSLDVYDAHECTGASPCFAPPPAVAPPCSTGDSCKPAPSPQPAIFGSPASATFAGAGNLAPAVTPARASARGLTKAQKLAKALRACRRVKGGKRRVACERRARKRYAAKRARNSSIGKQGRG